MKAIREAQETTQQRISNAVMLNKELLPSRGKYYAEDIFIRKMNAKEIKDLSLVNPDNANAIFNKIIGSCIEGIELNKILLYDKIWLIYYLRDITYNGMPFKIKSKCPECGKNVILEYTLPNLSVTYADTDLPESIELPNGDKVTPKYPTIGTEIQINRLKNDPNVITEIDEEIMTICSHITEINGEHVTLFEAYEYFADDENAKGSGFDFASFVHSMAPYVFGAKPVGKFTCTCGQEIVETVPLTPDFFLPKF